jgi:carbon monoxide dehydrogenase subunit G
MKFEFSGAPVIPAPRQIVWQRLTDPDFVAASAPGVESVEARDASRYTVVSGVGLGAMKIRFTVDVELFDIVDGEGLSMRSRGTGAGSVVEVVSAVRLEDADGGGTRLDWRAVSDVSGAVAGLGGRMVEGVARLLTEQFWTDFARRVRVG